MKKWLAVWLALSLLLGLCAPAAAEEAQPALLALEASAPTGYGGDTVTVSLRLTATGLGGMQTALTWNEGFLTYVEGSAAFSAAFCQNAAVSMVNDTAEGSLRLVYGSVQGYSCEDEAVFSAQFRLNDDVTGVTDFALSGTLLSDPSAASIPVQTSGVSVQTLIFDAGTAAFSLSVKDSYPKAGSTVDVELYGYTSGPLIGSAQGVITYDPNVLRYVPESAAFAEDYASAAFTKMFNTSTPGRISYVFASSGGCESGRMLSAQFEVIGGVNSWTELTLESVKASNNGSDRLAMMNCTAYGVSLCPQPVPEVVYYTTALRESEVRYGDTVTLELRADGVALGGLQTKLCYDAGELVYVPGTAAFTEAFASDAIIAMVNDLDGSIRIVYVNADNYVPDGSAIFTAQFVVKRCGTDLSPVTLENLLTTAPSSAAVKSIPSECLQGIRWNVQKGVYDLTQVRWDYEAPFLYDGEVKTVALTGLPEGVSVSAYENASASDVGEYTASARASYDAEHYEEPLLPTLLWRIDPPQPGSITLKPDSLRMLPMDQMQVTVECENPFAAAYFTWESSSKRIATVENGLVTAVSPGTVLITAGYPTGESASCLVTVEDWSLSRSELTLALDGPGSYRRIAAALPEFAGGQALEWSSTDENVITVDNGLIRACSEGSATVVARLPSGSSRSCTVVCREMKLMKLPAAVRQIGSEAFLGASLECVQIPAGAEAIGAGAFASTGLRYIAIPASVTAIAPDAFTGCDDLAIYCEPGSPAEAFAMEQGFDCQLP